MTKTKEKSMYEKSKLFTEIKNHKMIGKKVLAWVTGKEVLSEITRVWEDKYSVILETKHEPVNWGGELYTESSISMRKYDKRIICSDHLVPEDFETK